VARRGGERRERAPLRDAPRRREPDAPLLAHRGALRAGLHVDHEHRGADRRRLAGRTHRHAGLSVRATDPEACPRRLAARAAGGAPRRLVRPHQ
jgi:hypothetical protein